MLNDEFCSAASKAFEAQALAAKRGVTTDGFNGIIISNFSSDDGVLTHVVIRNYSRIAGDSCYHQSTSEKSVYSRAIVWACREQRFN